VAGEAVVAMPFIPVGPSDIYYEVDDFADQWRPHDTVFMQSGFCRNGNFWRGWVPYLARDCRVVRADLRGCGHSPDPGAGYRLSLDDYVDDFVSVHRTLDLGKIHYIGESLGGVVGALAGIKHPELFASLTLVSTPLRIRPDGERAEALEFGSWGQAMQVLGLREWWLRVRRESFTNQQPDPARDDYFAQELARTSVRVAVELAEMVHGLDLSDQLRFLTVPTLLMTPLGSRFTSADDQATLAASIPDVTIHRESGASHDMYYVMPDRLAPVAAGFIADHALTGRKHQ
jgi:3-oxoadipate enol-lactonase